MIINSSELSHNNFYQKIVKRKQPVLIKNVINTAEFQQLLSDNKTEMKADHGRGSVPFLYLYFDSETIRNYLFNLPLIKNLVKNKNTLFREKMRFWQHHKGNISHFHYDQRSSDLLNVCISGSKKWLFLPPEVPLKCLPFYNIALPLQKSVKAQAIEITMQAGDLLYIPRNWFHRVETLADNTENINIIFNDLADKHMQTREKELAAIKNFLIPYYIYGDNIAVLNEQIKTVSKANIAKRLLIELLPIVTVLVLIMVLLRL
ncbi:MAG: hypothetical protein COB35_03070 [Gammaproteobacteria bacterium]|nr:MAG: hypothetical protein COB35_03070 [Gammaproteobacteria bacterium]